jgi:hypothetical protein
MSLVVVVVVAAAVAYFCSRRQRWSQTCLSHSCDLFSRSRVSLHVVSLVRYCACLSLVIYSRVTARLSCLSGVLIPLRCSRVPLISDWQFVNEFTQGWSHVALQRKQERAVCTSRVGVHGERRCIQGNSAQAAQCNASGRAVTSNARTCYMHVCVCVCTRASAMWLVHFLPCRFSYTGAIAC